MLGGILRVYKYEMKNCESTGIHTQNRETTEVGFRVNLQFEDKSEKLFETKYEMNSLNARPAVYVHCARFSQTTPTRVDGKLEHLNNPDLLPSTIEEWINLVILTFAQIDPVFEEKERAAVAAQKAKADRLAARPNLGNLVKEGKLTEVTLKDYSYDCGDKRSCGALEVIATTNLGELKLEANLGSSGDLEDLTVTLNGEEANDDDLSGFDPGTPHYYSGRRAVSTWEQNAKTNLQEALEEYLGL